jgi:hypothetical protein
MTTTPATLRALVLLACFLAACGPSGESGAHGRHGLLGMHHAGLPLLNHALRLGMRGMRPQGLRRACAEDAARLCPDARTRREERECLESRRANLSADCRYALDARRDRIDRRPP